MKFENKEHRLVKLMMALNSIWCGHFKKQGSL